jgi:hypothetical protein
VNLASGKKARTDQSPAAAGSHAALIWRNTSLQRGRTISKWGMKRWRKSMKAALLCLLVTELGDAFYLISSGGRSEDDLEMNPFTDAVEGLSIGGYLTNLSLVSAANVRESLGWAGPHTG